MLILIDYHICTIMEEFVFNDCNICINPNKVKGWVKRFDWEIETACVDGKWVFGFIFGTPTSGYGGGAWKKDERKYNSEHDAIEAGAKAGISYFEREQKGGTKVPAQIFQQLKELCGKPKPIQMMLFDF